MSSSHQPRDVGKEAVTGSAESGSLALLSDPRLEREPVRPRAIGSDRPTRCVSAQSAGVRHQRVRAVRNVALVSVDVERQGTPQRQITVDRQQVVNAAARGRHVR